MARGGAAELFGITPDLATYAKAMGNGYPVAAFGGRREVMDMLPKHVSHGGTYAGNRVAAAAATKVLSLIRDTDVLETVARQRPCDAGGRRARSSTRRGLPHVFTGVPGHVRDHVHGHSCPPTTAAGRTPTTSCTTTSRVGHVHSRGAMPEPDSREPWFVCEAHAEADLVDRVCSAFEGSLDSALEARARA